MAHAGPGLCDGTAEVVVVEVKAAAVVVLLLPTVVLLLSGVSESSVWMQRVVRILAREFACVPEGRKEVYLFDSSSCLTSTSLHKMAFWQKHFFLV